MFFFCNINVIFRRTEDIYLESLNVSPVAQLKKKLIAIYVFFCNNDPPFDCPLPYTDTMHNKIISLQSKKSFSVLMSAAFTLFRKTEGS